MQNDIKHLFVYGSLRSGFKSPAYNYISQYFNFITLAKAKGILYDMGNYPVAVSTIENKYVIGELYEIKDRAAFDFVVAQLDDYEGIDGGEEDEVCLYERKLVEVYNNDNESIAKAYVYWFCGNIKDKNTIESGDMLEYFLQKK
jgi:gamma-glutamylcyclotransferase (GGCT)/AIG2-like uncharacterized protein YtfP